MNKIFTIWRSTPQSEFGYGVFLSLIKNVDLHPSPPIIVHELFIQESGIILDWFVELLEQFDQIEFTIMRS